MKYENKEELYVQLDAFKAKIEAMTDEEFSLYNRCAQSMDVTIGETFNDGGLDVTLNTMNNLLGEENACLMFIESIDNRPEDEWKKTSKIWFRIWWNWSSWRIIKLRRLTQPSFFNKEKDGWY